MRIRKIDSRLYPDMPNFFHCSAINLVLKFVKYELDSLKANFSKLISQCQVNNNFFLIQ